MRLPPPLRTNANSAIDVDARASVVRVTMQYGEVVKPNRAPEHDPFVVPPVDAETIELENALRRRGMFVGILIGSLGMLGILLGVLVLVVTGKLGSGVVWYAGGGAVAVSWGFKQYFNFRERDY